VKRKRGNLEEEQAGGTSKRASKQTSQVDVQLQTNENPRDKMLSEMSGAG